MTVPTLFCSLMVKLIQIDSQNNYWASDPQSQLQNQLNSEKYILRGYKIMTENQNRNRKKRIHFHFHMDSPLQRSKSET